MDSKIKVESLENDVTAIKEAITSLQNLVTQLREETEYSVNELRARLDTMSSSSF